MSRCRGETGRVDVEVRCRGLTSTSTCQVSPLHLLLTSRCRGETGRVDVEVRPDE